MKRKMRFGAWCAKDPDDARKINYRFTDSHGNVKEFTSDDTVSWEMLSRLNKAWIATVILANNEWYADIYED